MTASIPIGAFELHEPIGRGGMGEVWRAVHVAQGVPVAVKVLGEERALSDQYVTAFRREAERLASLDHPAIVTVLDYGTLPADVGERSGGRLVPGSPYLAMELAEGGALEPHAPLAWPEVVRILRVLLGALAHAHARGVIHRDLKPANVLLSGCVDGSRAEILLTDFGIAHALDRDSDDPMLTRGDVVGTPGFMAPEQVRGDWRDLGPHTDLYALGCLAWSLLAGAAPFGGDSPHRILFAQLTHALPALPSNVALSEPARAWIARLGQIDPRARFRRAADAALALDLAVGPSERPGRPLFSRRASSTLRPEPPPVLRADTETVERPRVGPPLELGDDTEAVLADTAVDHAQARASRTDAPSAARPSGVRAEPAPSAPSPPFPRSWRAGALMPPRMQLVGAGLSLYGSRDVPLAGRDDERDRIWRALAEVREHACMRIVVLRGASGVGKSRLLRWAMHRSHELGLATTLLATHGPERGPRDGIAPALARHLGCMRLTPERLRARLASILRAEGERDDPMELEALLGLLAPFACPGGAPRGTEREAGVHALGRALARQARERSVVLGLDDLQWGDESLRLLGALRSGGAAVPLLVIATVQDEATLVAPETRMRLLALEQSPDAIAIAVGSLGPEDHLRLVQDLLRLEPSLARELVRRTAGNPLFAEQLVGDWVRRGVLEVRDTGFALREGASVELPDDLHAVWIARVDRLLQDRPATDREALELAALLGHRVDEGEWERACEIFGSPSPRALAAALARARLVDRDRDASVAFVHGMLRESVLRRARESDRHVPQIAAIEALLRDLVEKGASDATERLGRLLAQTGRWLEAAPLLATAAELRRARCEYGIALALTEDVEACLDRARVPPHDPLRGRAWIVRSWTMRHIGDYEGALAIAERILAHRDADGWDEHVPAALLRRADVDARLGRVHRARADLEAAGAGLARLGDTWGVGQVAWLRAWLDTFGGELDAPLGSLSMLRRLTERPGLSPTGPLHVLWAHGFVHVAREEPDEADALYAAASSSAHEHKNRLGLAHARFGQASVALLRGANERAAELAREALSLYASVGSAESHFAELALAIALRRIGDLDAAERVLSDGAITLASSGRTGFVTRFETARVAIDALLGRWSLMMARLESAAALAHAHGHRETLLARELMEAAVVAEDRGRALEARAALALAMHHLDKPHTRAEHDALASRLGASVS